METFLDKLKRFWNNASSSVGKIILNTNKEGADVLSESKKNHELYESVMEYKKNMIKWIKCSMPKMEVAWEKWRFDKQEPWSVEIDEDNVFKMTLETGWYLQVNHKQIYTDEDKQTELSDLTGKKANERTEIQATETLELGKDYICKFSFMIPEDFPLLANRLVLGQWKQRPKWDTEQNPLLAQRIKRINEKDYLVFSINNSWDLSWNSANDIIGKIDVREIQGKWIDMEYQLKFSDSQDWYLKINANGKNIVNYNWVLSSSNKEKEKRTDKIYFKFGLYRDNYDYGIKLLKEQNKKEPNKNLEKEVAEIEKAKQDEKDWKVMTIYFKDYSIKENKSLQN